MAHFEGYKCDGCGIVRGEANHWLIGDDFRSGTFYGLARWCSDDYATGTAQHFCSITCALKRLNEHLEAK